MLITKLANDINGLLVSEEVRRSMLSTLEALRIEMTHLSIASECDLLGDWLNRRGLFRQANRIFSEYDRNDHLFVSVAFIDLDKFKAVNDAYGHKHGDEIIVKVAEIIQSSIRKVDVYGRLSGDEFVIILPGVTKQIASKILKRIRKKFCSADFSFNTEQLPISLSYGVVSTETDHEKTFADLLHRADKMMNTHKGGRRRQS